MTTDGWRCPECGLILAPSVTEHRCQPPADGITVAPVTPPAPAPGGVALNLSSAQIKGLTEEIQAKLLQQGRRNRQSMPRGRGAAA